MARPGHQKQLFQAPNPQLRCQWGHSALVPSVSRVLVLSVNDLAALVPAPQLTGPERGSDWHKITQCDGSWGQPRVPSLWDCPPDR